MTLHLCAFLSNAISLETAEVTFAIAEKVGDDGHWKTTGDAYDHYILPFWVSPVDVYTMIGHETLEIPDGWIEHVHAMAAKQAAERKAIIDAPAPRSLLARLGLTRTVPRRGL